MAQKIGWLCIAWAFFVEMVGIGVSVPLLLMIVGTILYFVN